MSARPDLAAVILAAGRSSRMASFKPLLPFGPHTIIEQVISIVRQADVHTLRVVVGWQADLLIPVLDRHGVPWIRNERFEEGMYSSIQAGVESLPTGVGAFFLLLGDMPLVQSATLTRLITEWDRHPGGMLHPCFKGRRGHPPLIASAYIPEILRESPAGGLRTLLARHAQDSREIECEDRGILLDPDTPDEYRRSLHK